MANLNKPFGFKPVKSLYGDFKGLIRKAPAGTRSSDTTNNHGDLYIGDPVKWSSGTLLPANSGDTVAGVVVGVGTLPTGSMGETGPFNPAKLEQTYLAYGDTGDVWYVPTDGVLFEIQSASDLDLALGAVADMSVDSGEAHGSRTTGLSSTQLVADANHDVTVVEHVTAEDNDKTLAYARYLVLFKKAVSST